MALAAPGSFKRAVLFFGIIMGTIGAQQWLTLPEYDPAEVENKIEVIYLLEIEQMRQRAGEAGMQVKPEWEAKHKAAIRNEIIGPRIKQEERAKKFVGIGLIALVLAAGMFASDFAASKVNPQ
tara:strand:+ start:81 stop:449 length:369 start_codon:yes stop_codon:yes gene_type:complete